MRVSAAFLWPRRSTLTDRPAAIRMAPWWARSASTTASTPSSGETYDPKSALYVHRLSVTGDAYGTSLGAATRVWAADQAARARKTWLRLDGWRTNTGLHNYYRRQGFVDVRPVSLPWRGSGARFQRSVGQRA